MPTYELSDDCGKAAHAASVSPHISGARCRAGEQGSAGDGVRLAPAAARTEVLARMTDSVGFPECDRLPRQVGNHEYGCSRLLAGAPDSLDILRREDGAVFRGLLRAAPRAGEDLRRRRTRGQSGRFANRFKAASLGLACVAAQDPMVTGAAICDLDGYPCQRSRQRPARRQTGAAGSSFSSVNAGLTSSRLHTERLGALPMRPFAHRFGQTG
jgi:hypothetical protein